MEKEEKNKKILNNKIYFFLNLLKRYDYETIRRFIGID